MRTTVDIDERTLERAKTAASGAGQTLGALVTAALNAYLSSPRTARNDPPFDLIVCGRRGGRFPSPAEVERAELDEDLARLGRTGRR